MNTQVLKSTKPALRSRSLRLCAPVLLVGLVGPGGCADESLPPDDRYLPYAVHGEAFNTDILRHEKAPLVEPAAPAGSESVALTSPYATQWALRGPYDVDLIEGNHTNIDIMPASNEPVVIGVVDTGVDYRHPEIAASMWTNPDEIPGNCIDDDGNGYIDDMHGIRVDVARFDNLLHASPGALLTALQTACTEHSGELSGDLCVADSAASAHDQTAIAGLNTAYARATTALDYNPLLYERSCDSGFGATRAQRIELARGDALDYWYGHGTQMAGTMAARSGVTAEPASLLDLPGTYGGKLGDHVKIVTCAAGFSGNVMQGGTFIMPRGSVDGAVECMRYFVDLKARGVNLAVINLSLGMAEQFPMIDGSDVHMVDDALLHKRDDILAIFDQLELEDIVVVAAAHNMFRDIDDEPEHAMYPAAFEHDNVISVGGINERGVWFGNRGRHTVDLAAPAQRIINSAVGPDLAMMARLVRSELRVQGATGDVPFDIISFAEGTSQATAYVSTMVALLRGNAATAQLSAPEIRRLLLSSATALPSIPWMLILRPAGNTALQAAYWLYLGMFEPTTRTLKQRQLSQNSRSGRIARLNRALACQSDSFERIVSPVQRQVITGEALLVEAESYTCAQGSSSSSSLAATVTRPDGTTEALTLTASGDGHFAASYLPTTAGRYDLALASAPGDLLTVQVDDL